MLLLIVMLGTYTNDIITVEFHTPQSCEEAKQFIVASTNNDKNIKLSCIRK